MTFSKKFVFVLKIILYISIVFIYSCRSNDYHSMDLFDAIYDQDLRSVEKLIKSGEDLNSSDTMGVYPIIYAIYFGNIDIIRMLISGGADMNIKDKYGETPVNYAIYKGQTEIVKLLIESGADIDDDIKVLFKQNEEESYSIIAKTLKILIRSVDLNKELGNDQPLAFYILEKNSSDTIQVLIDEGMQINMKCNNGNTPIMIASLKGDLNAVNILINSGADINLKNNQNWNALIFALSGYKTDETKKVVETLLKSGIDTDIRTNDVGWTPLTLSSFSGNYEIVKSIIDSGADLNLENKDGETALSIARQEGYKEIESLLLESGARD